ncbi:Zinc finger CCHC domain-containing protein 3 [Holothuria leucospilota]|uniref:Zinc finger CCHC domain-containing protein 3 n=1 Tax=Holothuria leucospilota TaxID=206669 RepID=A0A9Q1CFW0_HOLLE|nr:Zinc finger CCHC domain-containing protein 3 [Holothuria leucospilota]
MASSIRRDASILIQFSDDKDVFTFLEDMGVKVAEHLRSVQSLPGRRYDITFLSAEIRRQFWPEFSKPANVTCTAYSEPVKLVTVLHVPFELDDDVVRFVLKKYGKVLSGRFVRYAAHPTLFNGNRQYQMELDRDIPSSVNLGGRECWVRYGGQPRTCLKCGETGHFAKECKKVRCFRCLMVGHTSRKCVADIVCSTCNKSGHGYMDCPVSFAAKVRSGAEWTSGGGICEEVAEVVGNEKEDEGVDPVKEVPDTQDVAEGSGVKPVAKEEEEGDGEGKALDPTPMEADPEEEEEIFPSIFDLSPAPLCAPSPAPASVGASGNVFGSGSWAEDSPVQAPTKVLVQVDVHDANEWQMVPHRSRGRGKCQESHPGERERSRSKMGRSHDTVLEK